MNRRTDSLTASLVDAAIHAAATQSPVGAARVLVRSGVPWELIMRVLGRPSDRRAGTPGENGCARADR